MHFHLASFVVTQAGTVTGAANSHAMNIRSLAFVFSFSFFSSSDLPSLSLRFLSPSRSLFLSFSLENVTMETSSIDRQQRFKWMLNSLVFVLLFLLHSHLLVLLSFLFPFVSVIVLLAIFCFAAFFFFFFFQWNNCWKHLFNLLDETKRFRIEKRMTSATENEIGDKMKFVFISAHTRTATSRWANGQTTNETNLLSMPNQKERRKQRKKSTSCNSKSRRKLTTATAVLSD